MEKKVQLKAVTHRSSTELILTEKKALAFSKKLFMNHKREYNLYTYGHHPPKRGRHWYSRYRRTRPVGTGPEPFCNVEFIQIEP